jgi:hypothetical protein
MLSLSKDLEVVHVLNGSWLIDAESYQRRYWRAPGQCLARGFFVVRWTDPLHHWRFDEQADFVGPFVTRSSACVLRDQLEADARRTQMPGRQQFSEPIRDPGRLGISSAA